MFTLHHQAEYGGRLFFIVVQSALTFKRSPLSTLFVTF